MVTLAPVPAFAPDPAVPGRDALLAPAGLAGHLSRVLDAPVRSAAPVRAKYRIGESLRVVLRLDVGGAERLVAARTFPDGGAAAAAAAAAWAVPAGPLRAVAHDPALGAVWWAVPNDRRLRALPLLLDPPAEVAALCPGWRTSTLAELAPERSATAALLGAGGAVIAYGKAYAPDTADLAALARRHRAVAGALAGHPDLRAPRALTHSHRHDLLILEAMPGERWDHLDAAAREAALHRLGRGIAVLHGVDPAGLGTRPFGRLRPDRVARSCDLVAAALPDHADRVRRIADGLAHRPARRDRPVLLHGDCHPKNALATPHGLAIIDLDQAGVGGPAADVGSLLARLRHGAVLGETDAAQATRLAAAFLDGYATVRPPPDAGELHWCTAAALMAERAVRAVNRVHVAALGTMDGLLALAEDTLAEGAWR